MADTTGDLIDGMYDMRVRNAILITALRRLGGSVDVSHADVYDSACYDMEIKRSLGRFEIFLKEAPK